jgi:cation transport ATPase
MTGESLPVDKIKGDNVYTGTINCFGSIDIKVSK